MPRDELTVEEAALELCMTPELVARRQKMRDLPTPLTREWCRAYLDQHHRVEPGSLRHLYPS